MKRIMLFLLVCSMLLPAVSFAMAAEEDYSWLDDLTINQLRTLDAEIHKRLPNDDAANSSDDNASTNLWSLVFGGGAKKKQKIEPIELKIGELITTDSATFKVLEIRFLTTKKGSSSGWIKVSGHGVTGDFNVDSDCSLLCIFYRVKNTSTKSKWFWPSNLEVTVHWNEYEFEKLGAKPFGDLQSTQTQTYVAVAEIPNTILNQGCNDIIINMGFKEDFTSCSGLEYADHQFVMHKRH